MPYKKIKLIANVDDAIILQEGDYGEIEFESSSKQSFSGAERDFIFFPENCFFKIKNFDKKTLSTEANYDTIKFEFNRELPKADFMYFVDSESTYIFVLSNAEVISGIKIEEFNIDKKDEVKLSGLGKLGRFLQRSLKVEKDFIFFKSGRLGKNISVKFFEGDSEVKQNIKNYIDSRIKGWYAI